MAEPSQPCIFCLIVEGNAPCAKVHEDEDTLVFMDLFPVANGHTLVIPKTHSENLLEISDADVRATAGTVRRVAHAIRTAIAPDGIAVFQANGAAAGQTVFHYHTHLIPRMQGDPMNLHGRKQADPSELARVAREIAAALPE